VVKDYLKETYLWYNNKPRVATTIFHDILVVKVNRIVNCVGSYCSCLFIYRWELAFEIGFPC